MVNQVLMPPVGRGFRIAYWIVTILLCLNLFAGVMDLLLVDSIRESTRGVGFPLTIVPLFGILKIAGAVVLLFVKNPVLKIGSYAGVIFYFVGAAYAHLSVGQPLAAALPALVSLGLAIGSYWLWQRASPFQIKSA